MCENDSVGEKTDVKPAAETSSASASGKSTGVSKIFILTPEILQNLGLSGYTTTRIASSDSTKSIKLNLPTLQGIQANAQPKEGNKNVVTIGKLLENNAGNAAVIKKLRRDSASVEKSNDFGETSKSLVASSTKAEKRLNGDGKDKTVRSTKAKVPIALTPPKTKSVRRKSNATKLPISETRESNDEKTVESKNKSEKTASVDRTPPKAKNVRRKSNAVNLPSSEKRESNDKNDTETKNESEKTESIGRTSPKAKNVRRKSNAGNLPTSERRESGDKKTVETTNKSEASTPGVRTSKRVAKPKKFDDFVLTENALTHGRANQDEKIEKTRSRRSSVNSDSSASSPVTKSKKKEIGKANQKEKSEATGLVETAEKKGVKEKVSKPENSTDAESLSSSENCFAVPEPPTTVRRKSTEKSPEKRTPKATTANKILVPKETTSPKKGVEVADFKPPNSESRNTLPLREDGFLVPKSPTSVGKKKFHKAYETSYLIGKSTTDSGSLVAETTLEKGMEISASEEEKPEMKASLSTDIADSVIQKVEKTWKKGIEMSAPAEEKLKTEESLSTDTSERLREAERALKQTAEISVSEEKKSESNKNVYSVQSIVTTRDGHEKSLPVTAEAPTSASKIEKFEMTKSDATRSSEQTTEVNAKKSATKSSDKKHEAKVSKSTPRRSLDNKKETGDLTSNVSEPLDKEKMIRGSKSDRPMSVDGNKMTGGSETSKVKSQNEKSETNGSASGSRRSSVKREKVCDSKTVLLETLDKNENATVLQQHSSRSRYAKKTVNSVKSDPLRPLEKKQEISATKSDPLKCLEKQEEANSLKSNPLKSLEKKQKESNSADSDILKSLEKRETANSSDSDSLKSLEKQEEANSSKSDPLKSLEKKQKANSSKSDPLKSLEKQQEANSSKSDPLKSLKKQEEANSSKSDPLKSLEKKRKANSLKSDPLKSLEKQQKANSSKSDPLKSLEKQEEANSSKSDPLKSPRKNKEANSSKSDPLQSMNKKEEVSISLFDSRSSPDNAVKIEIISDTLSSPSKKEEVSISLFDSRSSPDNAVKIETLSDTLSSPSKEEKVRVPQFALPRTPEKKEVLSNSRFDSSESLNKKQRSIITQFSSPRSVDKKVVSISGFASSRSLNENEKISRSKITLPRSPDKEDEVHVSQFALPNSSAKSINFSDTEPNESIKKDENALHLNSQLSADKIECIETAVPASPLETQVHSESFNTKMEIDSTNDSDGDDNPEISLINDTTCYMEVDDFTNADDSSNSPTNIGDNTGGLSTSPVSTKVDTQLFNIEIQEHSAIHRDNNDNTEVTLINDTSLCINDTELVTDISLNKTSTADAIKVDDAISTPTALDTTIESPLSARIYSRRGRSRKSLNLSESPMGPPTEISVETADITVDESSVENTPRRRRRALRNNDVTDGKGLSDGSGDDAEDNEVKTRRRGRPSSVITHGPSRGRQRGRGRNRVVLDTEYVPRASSSGKEKTKAEDTVNIDNSQQETAIAETVETPKAGNVECGKCNERMEKKNWIKHNLSKHNNMGWLTGDPVPDWDNNLKQLRSLLAAVLKKKKRTQLTCETCGDGKRSVNGFISHLQFCGKTDDERQSLMVTCPICDHVMMPSSLEMHERIHRQEDKTAKEMKKKDEPVAAVESSTRGKRKAAEKAATKISEFTNLVKDDEPAAKKQRTKEEMVELIEKPRSSGNAPSRFKGMWKSSIAKSGKAPCRHQGCAFETNSFEEICKHHSECSFAPRSNWVCKLCLFSSQTEEEALKHVEAEHPMGRSREIADSDFENSNPPSSADTDSELSDNKPIAYKKDDRYQYQDYNVKFLDEEVKVDSRWPFTYPPALRWTMEFECKNYRLRLFEELSPNHMRLLERKESLEYLPELSVSMKVRLSEARNGKPAHWGQWERFEGTVISGIPTFFAGGPVWAIAWLPIPAPMFNRSAEQFVAISTHSTMENTYEVGKSYAGNNIIQIWNLGPLDHSKSAKPTAPVLSYGVIHDKGTIWCMEWCPSGCYEDPILFESKENTTRKKRMGLLAAACSDGCVHVFSLPFPDELEFSKDHEDSRLPIYETKPILTLTINTRMYDQKEQNWQCTKLNWCKELGHDTIIAGFSNGHVAMWDIGSKNPMFVKTRGETTFIDAFHHLYAHGHAISAVQLIPYGGKRFFVTSSYDRTTKLWDLEDTSFPITALKRGITVDGSWFTHWPAYATAYDDVLTYAHTYLLALRQPGTKIFPLLPTNSPAYSVTTSDFGNSVGHGSLAGEVVVMFPNHMWTYKDMERLSYKKRWLASTVEVVDFESEKSGTKRKKPPKTYDYMPETYDGCKDRYGLVFRDKLNRAHHHNRHSRSRNPFSDKLKAVNVEQYPFTSANRVSWNPNAWSYLWMCVAYQNGVVRFLNFNAVSLDKELRKLLPSHAKTMLNDAKTLESKSETNFDTSDPTASQMES